VVYIERDKANRINEILKAEKEFIEEQAKNEKLKRNQGKFKEKLY